MKLLARACAALAASVLLLSVPAPAWGGAAWDRAPEQAADAQRPADRVVLTTGETLLGRVTAQTDESITLLHPILGEVTIARKDIAALELAHAPAPAGADEAEPEGAGAAASGVTEDASLSLGQPADTPTIEPVPEAPAAAWSARFELGANGASGNSDTSSFYFAFTGKREAERSLFTIDMNYRLATENGATTTNRFFDTLRYERRLAEDGRWSVFGQSTQEFDEFKDYNVRATGSAGLSHEAIRTERATLKLYAGVGAAREFGGSDKSVNPFALLGAEHTRKINDHVSFSASGELEPRLDNVGEYRVHGKAKLDFDLNNSGSMKLSLGLEDEFDSDPGAAKKNDFYYFAAIVYSF